MHGENNIQRGLLRLKRIKVLFWVSFAGFLPFGMLMGLLFRGSYFGAIPIVIYMIGLFVLGVMESLAKCPNCSKSFHSCPLKRKFGGSFHNGPHVSLCNALALSKQRESE